MNLQFKYLKFRAMTEIVWIEIREIIFLIIGGHNMNLNEYLNCHKSRSFSETLFSFIDKSGFKDSMIYKKADIDRKLFSKIRCSENYIPRKNVIIKLCLALKLIPNDFNKLLNSAGYSLSESKFDRVISWCLENKIYDLSKVNDYLYTFCGTIL